MSEQKHVVIIGGGTAGITVAARLKRSKAPLEVTIIEPSERHFYQPLWTLVGGSLATLAETERSEESLMPAGVQWIKQAVQAIEPEQKTLRLGNGEAVTYDILVVCPGIQLRIDEVPGLQAALDHDDRVWTNYDLRYVEKGQRAIAAFKGGRALFTFPKSPLKCGGAPQKIMWIAEEWMRKNGVRDQSEVQFITPGAGIFGVPRYKAALTIQAEQRGVAVRTATWLTEVRHETSEVVLRTEAGETLVEKYDLLHATPHQRPFAFVKPLADADGFVAVDKETLQHTRFPEVFSLGDAAAVPTARTGAAVRKQAPVLVANMLAFLNGQPLEKRYNGYTSCPLVVGHKRVILAEFGYDDVILETFPFRQDKPRYTMWLLKRHLLPTLYWKGMLRGRA
ncbi:MAG: FAD/NAD(P)-binding oxidoreductase [bacterium]